MRVFMCNPPAADGVRIVREGRCMQRQGAWTAVWAPVTLALGAAVLLEQGHEVILHDCIVEEIDYAGVQRIVAEFKPDVVVINTATPSIESDLGTARIIKQVDKRVFTAALGIHVTVFAAENLRDYPELDAVIRGEPEFTIRDLVAALASGESLDGIEGLSFRRNGGVAANPDRPRIASLDLLPSPAWQLVQRHLYRMPFMDQPFLLIPTGRGCPYQCRFCADPTFYGHTLATRSPRRVVDEMVWIRDTFEIMDFLFWSESFTINARYAMAVAEEILRRGGRFRWVCNSRVDNVDLELLIALKKAGCWMIGYGIEVGTQAILDRMHKGTTLEQAHRAVRLAHTAGLEVTGHCVLGYPGETREMVERTIDFTLELDLDFAQYYCAVPFPGAELYEEARAAGWIVSDDWSRFEQNFSVLTTGMLAAEDVMELRRKAFRKFYMRPKTVLRTIRRLRSRAQVLKFLSMVRDFITWV
ncbi:radical SAM protein [bacterium]|nr:radical SAM protein [candidate division CSSED10-310 bacterium]